ncbi:hypothetical protein [Nocardia sp. NPDC049707]|uniref:hypothetical protein n=1 Tax=Nocardia sp. NPDC049707 TaxID=3154735 RepID=UPI0034326A14
MTTGFVAVMAETEVPAADFDMTHIKENLRWGHLFWPGSAALTEEQIDDRVARYQRSIERFRAGGLRLSALRSSPRRCSSPVGKLHRNNPTMLRPVAAGRLTARVDRPRCSCIDELRYGRITFEEPAMNISIGQPTIPASGSGTDFSGRSR